MKLISGALLMISLMCSQLNAAELKVAFATDKPPFSFKDANGTNTGIEVDVVRAALEKLGHTVKPVIVPNTRLIAQLQDGEVELSAAVQGKDGGGLFYSNDFVEYVNFAISRKSKNISVNTIKDLDKYTFVIWQKGWADLGPEFMETYKPKDGNFRANYSQANNQRSQNLMFWSDRVDLIVVDKTIFEYFQKELRKEVKTDAELTYHPIIKSKTGFPVVFKDKGLRDKFNEALQTIKSDGTHQKILNKYKAN